MARISLIIALGVVILAAAACGSSGTPGRLSVVTAFYPLAYAAEEIGGGSVKVENLTPPGAEPHDIELTPQQAVDLQRAKLVL